jgi:tetratricopeptide (TPR) repeat protein
MPFFLLAMAAATAAQTQTQDAEHRLSLVDKDPAKAIEEATSWQVTGGGLLARQCLGLGFAAQKRWLPAMAAFEQGAREAERNRDGRAARLWVQAGNAALAGGDAAKARGFLDTAIISGGLSGPEKGEAHLDRARTLVALRQPAPARADIDAALALVPQDPLAWLLSATLARRSGDLDRAGKDILEAVKRSPDDAQVALEAGNIALMKGEDAIARSNWEAAVKLAPGSAAGKSAAESLSRLGK